MILNLKRVCGQWLCYPLTVISDIQEDWLIFFISFQHSPCFDQRNHYINSKSGVSKEAVEWMCQSSDQAPLSRPQQCLTYLHYTLLHFH